MVAILKPLAQGKSRTFRLGGCRLLPVSLWPSRHPSLPCPRLSRDRPPKPPEAGLRAPRVRSPLLGRFSLWATLPPPQHAPPPSRFPHINNSKCERRGRRGPAWAEGGLRLAARSPAPSRSLGPRGAGKNGILFYFSLSRGRSRAYAGSGRAQGRGCGGRAQSEPSPSPRPKSAHKSPPARRRSRGAGVLGAAVGGRTHPLGGIVLLHHSGWARAPGEGAGWRSCPPPPPPPPLLPPSPGLSPSL